MVQTKIILIVNKNLFSDHYIKERLPQKLEEWREEEKIKEVFKKATELYNSKKELLSKYNEAQLEDNFIKPILKEVLGHHFEVQETTYEKGKQPDYAFFPDEKTKEDAIKHKGEKDFYIKAIAVGDAKRWDLPLDKKVKGGAAFEDQNPSFQIDTYLRETSPRWAILTNGRCWRIYYQETSYKLDSYYEVDLVDLIERKDIESFKYFYFFFRLEAFLEDVEKKNFLDRVYEKSIDYAKELGEGLQNNIYESLKILAEGFLNWKENNLIKNKDNIKIIHDNSLVLLYRIIFILYSEARGLLDITKDVYNKTYSLNSLKKEIAEKYKHAEFYPYRDDYWHRLNNLFTLINEGSRARGIPEKDFSIPSYNGGLFDPQKNSFLAEKSVGDYYLAKVIDLLARSNGGFVDYSTLDIRHLGSIYEGLLEYKLNTASEDMVAIKEKSREKWISKKDADGKKICYEVNEGGLYLTTDKGERKATGSYYTPEYIVKYIVKNTLEPVVEEKLKEARKNNTTKESNVILAIKVLDPAMGSGHFLVEAVDFLTTPLLEAVANDVEKGLLPEGEYSTEWAKREIVSHCIYGVDLNPLAVELAKLSLWLRTIAKDKPLSFLDHRIKCGNSLIGANLIDLPWHPSKKRDETKRRLDVPEGFIKKLVDTIQQLTAISDDTLEDIKEKERIFTDLKTTMEYDMIKTLADVRTSIYFGNEVDESAYGYYTGDAFHSSQIEWKERREKWFARKGREIAESKPFFHWELEFPEIFFEEGKIKENPGFDVVVGNPPWGAAFDKQDKSYLSEFFESYFGDIDSCNLFTEKGIKLNDDKGRIGFITPNTWLYTAQNANARKYVLTNSTPLEIVELEKNIFEDVPDIVPIVFSFLKEYKDEKCRVKLLKIKYRPNDLFLDKNFRAIYDVNVKLWRETEGFVINTRLAPEAVGTLEKIISNSVIASEVCDVLYGIKTGDNTKFLSRHSGSGYVPSLVHAFEVERYSLSWDGNYLHYTPELEGYRNHKVDVPKIIIQYTRKISMPVRIMAAFDYEGLFYPLNTFSYITEKQESGYNLMYLMAVFSSSTLNFYHANTFIDYGIKPTYLQKHPIRRISFTTLKEEREKLVMCLKQKYQDGNIDETLKMVEECLPKDKDGNFITKKEKSDVVHDFLAFLAEQMIEMNKEKNVEVKGFLKWLEREIGAKIDDLSNKTVIKEYYKNNFEKLIEVLKKNKKKISIDPSRREFQEKVKNEFDKSRAKLTPLREKIQATDNLIDQIVYKLYGLTEEEVKVVEESI